MRGESDWSAASPNSNCVEVEVLLFRIDFEYTPRPCTEMDAALSDKLEGVPVAGIGYENRAGDVHPINFNVEPAIGEFAADFGFNSIGARPADPDGVLKPFASLDIIYDVACRVACASNDVHVFAGSVQTSGIASGRVVIGHSFTTEVKVLRFDQPRHGEWRAVEGSLGAWGGKGPERLIGRHREVSQRILGLHPVVVEGAGGQAAQGLGVGGDQRGDERRGAPVGGRRPVLQLGVRVLIGGPRDCGL